MRANSADAQNLAAVERHFSHAGHAEEWNALYQPTATNNPHAASEAPHYERFRARRDVAVSMVRVLAADVPGFRALDLGCGTGPVLVALRTYGISVVGFDYSADMLDHARQRLTALHLDTNDLLQGDCRDTGLTDASFNVIVCLGVISFVDDYRRVLGEAYRLLHPGGTLLVSYRNCFAPRLFDPLEWLKSLYHIVKRRSRSLAEPEFEAGRFLDPRQVAARLDETGFIADKFIGIGYGPLRIAGRTPFSSAWNLRLSGWISGLLDFRLLKPAQRWLADVCLVVVHKPAGAASSGGMQ
jgi:SAM-dependent methyltransferase